MSQLKTKELRQFLFNCAKKVEAGELAAPDARNIVGMANQINLNMHGELKRQAMAVELGQKAETFGELVIG